jgi:hypothetical protein
LRRLAAPMVVRIEPLVQKLLAQALMAKTLPQELFVPGGLVVLFCSNWSLK